MTGTDIMTIVRQRAADNDKLNLTDELIKQAINTGIRYVSQILISRKAPEMMSSEDIVDYTAIPQGFHSFVGQQPAWQEGDVLRCYDTANAVPIKYWQMRQGISSLSDEMPFNEDYTDAIVTAALTICLNKDEFDTTFEQGLLDKIGAMLPGSASK